jgi:hypothetical protein
VLRENGLKGICYTKEEFQRRAARADAVTRIFHNLPFCEFGTSPIALPDQGFANLEFNRSKICSKQVQIARIGTSINHTAAFVSANSID